MTPTDTKAHKQRISAKLQGYGEGVVHGFEVAQEHISKLTGGLLTLNEPQEITAWRERLKRSQVERGGSDD